MARQSARERALETPEILEAILLFLSLREIILNAQLVSSFFQDTICESPLIQQALFFGHSSAIRTGISAPNPLLVHSDNSRYQDSRASNSESRTWPDHDGLTQLDWEEFKKKRLKFTIKCASWKKMMIVNPPIYELTIQGGNTIRNKDGITMGQLENVYNCWSTLTIGKDGRGKLLSYGHP